jgi:predicted nucleic acid-binding protein
MNVICPDTGVIVEYANLDGMFHAEAQAIFQSVIAGKLDVVIPHPILAETYYVSLRIYKTLGLDDCVKRAKKLVQWLYTAPNISLAEPSLELAILAGDTKDRYGISMMDSYVLALSKLSKGKAVFRTEESEMKKNLGDLSKRFNIVFLGT